LIPTFHPAAALRGTPLTEQMRQDFALVRSVLDRETEPNVT
jgi:hypothetical protein